MVIKWNKAALKNFEDAIAFIEKDSIVNAERVKLSILKYIDVLPNHPEKYDPDKYKIDNDGSYRAF